jgi:hypothetical protein
MDGWMWHAASSVAVDGWQWQKWQWQKWQWQNGRMSVVVAVTVAVDR